jgi:hypothetical protein
MLHFNNDQARPGHHSYLQHHSNNFNNIILRTLKAVAALISGGELPKAAVMSSCFCRSLAAALL